MAVDLQPLIGRFYDYFLGLYHQQKMPNASVAQADGGNSAKPFLAFDGIGISVTPQMFELQDGTSSLALVAEQFSSLANLLPEIDGTTITGPGLLSADGVYGAILAQAQPLTAEDLPGLGSIKGPAQQAFERASTLPLIHGGEEYRPAVPTPPDWPLQSSAAAWHSYSDTSEQRISISASSPPSAPPRPDLVWRWRVAPPTLLNSVKSVATVAATVKPPAQPPATPLQRMPMLARSNVAMAAPFLHAPVMLRPSSPTFSQPQPAAAQAPALLQTIRLREMQAQVQMVKAQSQPQAVTSTSMELSFQYCLVTAQRPWVCGPFLTARNWFIPHTRAGEIASGTGHGRGYFETIPTAALCVHDLVIKAEWSAEERQALPAMTKFGPFSLIGSKLDASSASLLCPGTQIIAWVMEPLPALPPNSDPSLPAA